jgi:hypothetical protein
MGFFSDLLSRARGSASVQSASFPIPAERVLDKPTDADVEAFSIGETYLEIRVSQMFLKDRREYLRGFVPLASLLTRVRVDGRERQIPAIVGPETLTGVKYVQEADPIEILNRRVAGPLPYDGDDVALFAGLFRVEVANWAKQALVFAESIGKALDVTKLSSYLDVADAVSNAIYDLLGMQELEFRLGNDRTFIGVGRDHADGDGSASLLEPGFHLIVGADDAEVRQSTRDRLWVQHGRVHVGDRKEALERWREHDFLLLRTAALARRDDLTSFRFHAVHWPRVQEEVWAGRGDAARAELRLLGAELARTSDITRRHRAALVRQYRAWYDDETAQYEALVSGADDTRSFDDAAADALDIGERDLAAALEHAPPAAADEDAALIRLLL